MKIFWRIRKKFLLKLFILLALLGAFWFSFEKLAGNILLPIARSQIERHTGSEVKIGGIDVALNGLVRMKWVVVTSCIDETGQSPLLVAETVEGRFALLSILRFRPRLKSLTVEDFILDVRYDRDLSAWNMAFYDGDKNRKKPPIPALLFKRGMIRLSKVLGGTAEKIFSVGVKKGVVANAEKENGPGFSFEINPAEDGFAGVIAGELEKGDNGQTGRLTVTSEKFSTGSDSIFGNAWDVREMRLDLGYDRDDLTINTLAWEIGDDCRFSFSGEVKDYQHECNYSGRMRVENVFVSDKARADSLVYDVGLSENVGEHLRKFLGIYKPRGVCDFDFKAVGRFGELAKSKWSGTVTCKDILIRHKKFPYLLEHMTGDVNLSEKGIDFSSLQCRHGDVVFDITGGTKTIDGLKVTDVVVASDNMLLGNDVYRALTKKQQSIWYTFTPKGRAKVRYKYHRRQDQEKGVGKLEINMLGGEADYLHFPYHLENITGRVTISAEKVELINLVSGSQDSSITLNGKVTDIRSERPRYDIIINANNIPLDSRLKAALPYSQRSFYDSFKMTARTDAEIKIFPNEVGKRPVEYIAKVSIKDALLMYADFPLPLSEVNVDAILTPAGTFLKKMTGRNGDGTIEISGTVWPANETHSVAGYCLELNASNIQVEDRWLKSLPADSYKILSQLRPEGAINVAANLSLDPRTQCRDFKIVVESLGGRVNYKKFPYPIEGIYGKVTVERDKVSLDNIKAVGPDSGNGVDGYAKSIAVDGVILFGDKKFKKCKLSLLAKNIECDDKLGKALEGFSGDFYKSLNPSGRFDLAIDEITYHNDGDRGGLVDFVSDLTLKEFTLNDGVMLGGINGTIKSAVAYKVDEGLVEGKGRFKADKIKIKGRSVTDVRGGIVYDPNEDSLLSREYTAKCYGGKVLGGLSLTRGKDKKMEYAIETIFSQVDLQGLVAAEVEAGKSDNYIKGQVSGHFAASGVFGDDRSRVGRLNMEVSEMAFAERTLLGKIITASQMEEPTDYIFSDVNVESYLQGDTLFLNKVEIFGKSMQMKGAGEVNMSNGNIEMDFSAFGKRTTSKPSFIETLKRSLGSAVVEVEVDGTFDKPEIKTTTLPMIKKPFGILGTKDK